MDCTPRQPSRFCRFPLVRDGRSPLRSPLSADGWQQAHALAQRLAQSPIARIYASPFLRTVQTASAIAQVLGLTICLEPGLGEWLHPDWMTATPARLAPEALAAEFPIDLTYRSPAIAAYPETEADLLARTAATAQRLTATPENQLWIGHERSVFGAIAGLVGRPPLRFRVGPCVPCPISTTRAIAGIPPSWPIPCTWIRSPKPAPNISANRPVCCL
ncbi:MAG: histidine phosphatase family protein [Oscillatoriales cyanobacterium SM2_1_8]|nr:histidine phosphatase family protein [Oscillatoriales cyanobacterium SM2_1_8]